MEMGELYCEVDKWMIWCARHHREGIVIKDYGSEHQVFVKEKIDLPDRARRKSAKKL